MITGYKIVSGKTFQELEANVQVLLNEGWELYKRPFENPLDIGICQTMYLSGRAK